MAWRRLRNKRLWRLTAGLAVIISGGLIVWIAMFGNFKMSYEPDKLDLLVLRLERDYKRQIDVNNFSLHYQAEPPNTVVLRVMYNRKANMTVMYNTVSAARDLVKTMAARQFNLQFIRVREDISRLD